VKKGGTGEIDDTPAAAPEPKKVAQPKSVVAQPKQSSAAPLPRGQKAKAKKMKEKYSEQDDEERELRLALLGSKMAHSVVGAVDDNDEASPTSEATASASAVAAASPDTAVAASEKPLEPWKKRQADAKVAADAKELTVGCEAEPGTSELLPEQLDVLTGQPLPDDEVTYVMPMVAPYCSLGNHYAYRIKLTPGPTKKGQAARQCIKMFDAQIDRKDWKLLLSAVPEQEPATLMNGTCKLSMPGMNKLVSKAKKDQKKEKQAEDKGGGTPAKKKGK